MKYLKTYKLFERTLINNEYMLDCNGQDHERLPKLHNSLERLYCQNNKLKSLPKLPILLNVLNCRNNKLKSLPKLPESLECLSCENNQLKSLPELPYSLQYLDCENNQLKSLPKLPGTLEHLCCHNNPLECLIPEKFIKQQNKEWLENYYYPMIKSYEGQKRILKNDITQLDYLKSIGLDPKIKEEYIDIIKQTDWS